MEILFDKNGLITPKEIIEISLKDFERIFVEEREEREHRAKIFQKYLEHNAQIQKEVGLILFQFVNGSFTTLKNKPKDIDVVSFIDYRIFQKKQKTIKKLVNSFEMFSSLDGYIAPKSYPGHPHFIYAQLNYEYWKNLFSYSRPNDLGERSPKGLIKINFYE